DASTDVRSARRIRERIGRSPVRPESRWTNCVRFATSSDVGSRICRPASRLLRRRRSREFAKLEGWLVGPGSRVHPILLTHCGAGSNASVRDAAATAFARNKGHIRYDPATAESRRRLRESLTQIRKGRVPRYARKWKSVQLAGTVGAVARDRRGRFAAGTSTGGTAFMLPGRVGDSPIVGAGLYAGPHGAVSATGFGEAILKRVLSKFVYDRMAEGLSAQRAADRGVALFPK